MKKLNKIVSLALAIVMMFAMCVTSFAAETNEKTNVTVTISNADDAKIMYGQIVAADRTATDGWKFVEGVVSDITIKNLIAYAKGQKEEKEDGILEAGKMTASSDIANAATAFAKYATTEGSTTLTLTKAGMYVITASKEGYNYAPMLVYVPADSTKSIALKAKGSDITIKKDIVNEDDKSVDPGDEVEFQAEMVYPFFSKAEINPKYEINDALTNATFKGESLKVVVGETELKAGVDYTVNAYADTDKMNIVFNYDAALANQDVVVTYTAIAGEGNVDNKIEAVVGDKKSSDEVEVAEVIATIVKTDEEGTKLEGAKFQLYKADENGTATIKVNGADVKVTAIDDVKVTDANGNITWKNLDAQDTYYVEETEAPVGYKLPENNITELTGAEETTVDGSKKYTFSNFTENDNTILNTKLSSLPFTGGIGTTIFTVLGVAIMVVAAGLFFATRKKNAR